MYQKNPTIFSRLTRMLSLWIWELKLSRQYSSIMKCRTKHLASGVSGGV